MILHLVINCDPCVDHQIHTYLTIACISDVLVKSDLKFYFMAICKDINTNVCHLYIFLSRQKRKEYYLFPIKTYLEMLRMFLEYKIRALEQLLIHST